MRSAHELLKHFGSGVRISSTFVGYQCRPELTKIANGEIFGCPSQIVGASVEWRLQAVACQWIFGQRDDWPPCLRITTITVGCEDTGIDRFTVSFLTFDSQYISLR